MSSNILATDRELKGASATTSKTDFRIKGAPGLQLRVTPLGSKSWALAYKSPATGKWSKTLLGRYPAIGLAEARICAQELSVAIRNGKDPKHSKLPSVACSDFAELSRLYIVEHATRNSRGGQRSRSTDDAQMILDRDLLPKLGRLLPDQVSRRHVSEAVETIAARGSFVAADRALGLVRAIYNWAGGTGRLECNPTLGLKKRAPRTARTRVLSMAELKIFWLASESMTGMSATIRDALRLQLLTGARISEVLEAELVEIDFNNAVWTIPAKRTKANREHILPLSPLAAKIFRSAVARATEAKKDAGNVDKHVGQAKWIFPSARTASSLASRTRPHKTTRKTSGAFDPHAATRCLVRCRPLFASAGIREPFNTHDLRRTCATHLGEDGVMPSTIERILNHAPTNVTGRHYNHAKLLIPMREALTNWSERLAVVIGEKLLMTEGARQATDSHDF